LTDGRVWVWRCRKVGCTYEIRDTDLRHIHEQSQAHDRENHVNGTSEAAKPSTDPQRLEQIINTLERPFHRLDPDVFRVGGFEITYDQSMGKEYRCLLFTENEVQKCPDAVALLIQSFLRLESEAK